MEKATFTLALDADLRDRFLAETEAVQRPAQEVIRALMQDFVDRRHDARDGEVRADIEQALIEADDPAVGRISNGDAMSRLRRQRAEMVGRRQI